MSLKHHLPWHMRVAVAIITAPVRVLAAVFLWLDEKERRKR